MTAGLVRSQLLEDGTYPGAAAAGAGASTAEPADKPATAPLVQRGSGGSGTLGSILSLFNPIGTAEAQERPASASGSGPVRLAVHIGHDPLNEESPEDREEEELREEEKEQFEPLRGGPRLHPDGTVSIPLPPGGGVPAEPRMPPPLHQGQQDKHIPGTNNYDPKRSIFEHPDPQGLLDRGAGTGSSANGIPVGQPGSKERVDFGEYIGQHVDLNSNIHTPTTKGMIYYSKKGAHIAPIRPGDKKWMKVQDLGF